MDLKAILTWLTDWALAAFSGFVAVCLLIFFLDPALNPGEPPWTTKTYAGVGVAGIITMLGVRALQNTVEKWRARKQGAEKTAGTAEAEPTEAGEP